MSARAEVAPSSYFADLYSEQVGIAKAKTFATYSQVRAGWQVESKLQTYVSARIGADSRTILEKSDSVYNDNYCFLGIGLDYLDLIPGLRFTFQLGASQDLSDKIHRGGFDARAGVVSYHELLWSKYLHSEIYSDLLYFQRYQNILASAQFRLLQHLYKGPENSDPLVAAKFKVEPMLSLAGSFDSAGLEFNRFLEGRLGVRVQWRGPLDVAFIPYFALGGTFRQLWDRSGYHDWRGLLVLSKSL